ncbi:MAG: S8 family serine peptidase, partial [Candidatus Thermoplasmatota archaeon]|nr:S8 family serine peptidase [Candidatus Thermoplasmatota archaeon]
MPTPRARVSTFLVCLMLAQLAAPFAMSQPLPAIDVNTDAELDLLAQVGILPTKDHAQGWYDPAEGLGTIDLLYRQATITPLGDWSERTQEKELNGNYVLTHTYPVPSDWLLDLEQAGIDCFSFLPVTGFHCEVEKKSIDELSQLDVEGVLQLDPTDKVRSKLIKAMLGENIGAASLFYQSDFVPVHGVLSGKSLPDGIHERDDIRITYHMGRFATFDVDRTTNALSWLVAQGEIEWVEQKPWAFTANDVADTVLKAPDLWSQSTMNGINSSWNGVDGSGIIVTVADTGLDSGVNDSTMHADFSDHILDIVSWGMTASEASSCGSQADDGASDIDGHGTHVAGSVLGDGTNSSGNIKGMAPEAQLYFQAIGVWCANAATSPRDARYSLNGLPSNLIELFKAGADNGSRVHTNSWGSAENGAYNTYSMQADIAARDYQNMTILFSAGNNGVDTNGNGEVDLDSLGAPASAKSVLTVGASENNRPTINSVWGTTKYSAPISSDRVADNISGLAAFSSRGPTDDNRLKPDIVAPGTFILSALTRYNTKTVGWAPHSADYVYMGGTSMSTPLTAGATALLLEHLIDNMGHEDPNSSLVKAIFAASATDMVGQYNSASNGAGETAPNNHEGWGRVDMRSALNTSWIDNESVTTGVSRGWSFNIPPNA